MNNIQIVPYNNTYSEAIRDLNYEWLLKYFKLEPGDIKSLNNPQREIIDKGGIIFMALLDDEPVGTFCFLKKSDTVFELGKMAVTERVQGLGIGKLMLDYAISHARNKQWEKLILYSNTGLASAIHLYKKYGFVEILLEPGLYDRADIKMEKIF